MRHNEESVGQVLTIGAVIRWIGYLGLFIFLNYSVFPWVAEWLKIIRH